MVPGSSARVGDSVDARVSKHESRPAGDIRLRGHLPALDGLRGLAIVAVMLLHFVGEMKVTNRLERNVAAILFYGHYGVDLFFLLSGFLITGILYDGRNKPNHFRNFYARRVLRIFPLYYAVLVAVFVVAPWFPGFQDSLLAIDRRHQAWAWLYAVNIYMGLHGPAVFPYLGHFWSLAVEEQFYLCWPFVFFLLVSRPRRLLQVSFAIALASACARFAVDKGALFQAPQYGSVFLLTPFQLDGLTLGAFLALFGRREGGMSLLQRWIGPITAVALALLLGTLAFSKITGIGTELLQSLRSSLLVVLLATLLLRALTTPITAPLSRFLRSGPMVFFGKYSYGLYVFHRFISYTLAQRGTELVLGRAIGSHTVAVALQALVGGAVSIAVAVLSYHLFEKHFLSLKRFFPSA